MFGSLISFGASETLPGWEKPHVKTVTLSYDMEGHAQKMRREILRTGEQKDRAAIQSLKSLLG